MTARAAHINFRGDCEQRPGVWIREELIQPCFSSWELGLHGATTKKTRKLLPWSQKKCPWNVKTVINQPAGFRSEDYEYQHVLALVGLVPRRSPARLSKPMNTVVNLSRTEDALNDSQARRHILSLSLQDPLANSSLHSRHCPRSSW